MTLHQRTRQALAQASVLAEASAATFDAPHSGKPRGDAPTGQSHSLHDVIAQAFGECTSTIELERAVTWAERQIQAQQVRQAPRISGETLKDRNHRIIRDYPGWSPAEVATSVRCSETEVRKARRQARLNTETGKPRPNQPPELSPFDRARQVRDLRRQGLSYRQIEERIGVTKSTAQRLLAA